SALVSCSIPVQHPQGTQRVPPAGLALALVHFYRHRAGVPGLEQPPPVIVALGLDERDCFSHALVRSGTGFAQVVESPQHIIVPPGREGKARKVCIALAIPINHLASRKSMEETALEEILLSAEAGLLYLCTTATSKFV